MNPKNPKLDSINLNQPFQIIQDPLLIPSDCSKINDLFDPNIQIDHRPNLIDPIIMTDILKFMDLGNGLYYDVKELIESGKGYKTLGEWIFHFGTFGTYTPLYYGCPGLFYAAVKQTMYDLDTSDGMLITAIQRGKGDINKTHWEVETMKNEKYKREIEKAKESERKTQRKNFEMI